MHYITMFITLADKLTVLEPGLEGLHSEKKEEKAA